MAKLAIMSLQASDAFALTPDDDNDITADAGNTQDYKFCYIHVAGDAGTIKITTVDGTDVTVYGAQGATLPVLARRVWATGTTATNLVAFIGRNKV